MSFPRHSKLKASGNALLGEIPVAWTTSRVRYLTAIQKGRLPTITYTEPLSNSDVPYLSMEYLRGSNDVVSSTYVSDDGSYVKANSDDILVLWDGSNAGEFLRAKAGVVSSTLAIVKAQSIDRDFLFFSLKSAEKRLKDQTIGMGIPHVSSETLRDLTLCVPPPEEQSAIVLFLKQETKKIDALVAEQEKLIDLLIEKLHVVISQAVTKGLDTKVKMKDSGNLWLGDVPSHWKLGKLKHIKSKEKNSFVDGPFGSNLKSEHFIDNGDVYVIESNFATQGRLDQNELKTISFEHFEKISRSEVREGDIVIAKIGAQYGKSSVLPEIGKRAVVSGNSLKLTVNKTVCDTDFVNWFLTNLKALGVIEDIVNATAQPALSLGELNNLPMLIPSLIEQKNIVSFISARKSEFQTLIKEANESIALLQERRSALISAAVSGEIDVRGIATQMETA